MEKIFIRFSNKKSKLDQYVNSKYLNSLYEQEVFGVLCSTKTVFGSDY